MRHINYPHYFYPLHFFTKDKTPTSRTSLSRAHTSVKAADVAKLLLFNKCWLTHPTTAFAVRYSTYQTPQAVWQRGSGGQVPGSLPCSQSMHMAQSQELEAASGRPRHTWLRTVEADLRPFNLGLASGFKKAQDRTTWRALTGIATSPTSPE